MAAQKCIDRSALLRTFFLCALKEYTIRDSLEDYKAGITTLWEAAQRCNLSLWEMIQEVVILASPIFFVDFLQNNV